MGEVPITRLILSATLFLILTSCSLAPFSPNTSGQSYGAGKVKASVGNVNSTYHIKIGTGVSESMDIGFVMEFGAISTSALFFKYSFMNNKTGLSNAFEFGYGSTDTTKFYYTGLISSLAFTESFELFLNPRINIVSTDSSDIELGDANGNIIINEYDVTYLQLTSGMNLWFSENVGMTLYATYFTGNDIETVQDTTTGFSFMFKY